MPGELDDLLRRALADRAAEVRPDPRTWSRVTMLHRRRRTVRVLSSVVAAAAALAVVAVIPGRLGTQTELAPGQPAPAAELVTPPPPVDTSAAEEPALGTGDLLLIDGSGDLVRTDRAGRVFASNLDVGYVPPPCPAGASCIEDYGLLGHVSVRPGSTAPAFDAAIGTGTSACTPEFLVISHTGEGIGQTTMRSREDCAQAPHWSPQGSHLAVGGAGTVVVVPWDGAGETIPRAAPIQGLHVRVDGWLSSGTTDDLGFLSVSSTPDGVRSQQRVDVEQGPDGLRLLPREPIGTVDLLAVADGGSGRSGDDPLLEYQLRVYPGAGTPPGIAVTRLGSAVDADLPGFGLAQTAQSWMSARGDTVLVGDGAGHAWLVQFPPSGAGAPDVLDLPDGTRGGAILDGLASPPVLGLPTGGLPTVSEAPPPQTTPSTPITPATVPLPLPLPEPEPTASPSVSPSPRPATAEFEVAFLAADADCTAPLVRVTREVPALTPARGVVAAFLDGPSPEESLAGIVAPLPGTSSDMLLGISIADGTATVDFSSVLTELAVPAPCGPEAFRMALDVTLLQLGDIDDVVARIDGSAAAFDAWAVVPGPEVTPLPTRAAPEEAPESPRAEPGPPAAVEATADALRAAAVARDYDAMRALLPADGGFTCSYGAPDDCIAYYQSEEEAGREVFAELGAALVDSATAPEEPGQVWTWPQAFGEEGYVGWRVGIAVDGSWRFFVAGG